jgi:hypothetical protein
MSLKSIPNNNSSLTLLMLSKHISGAFQKYASSFRSKMKT